jgi:hypothetical protein
MKQLFTLLVIIVTHIAFAQAPQSIPYQAIVRNTDGSVIGNTPLTMTFKIHDVLATGTVVYEENHTTASNAQGLVALNVGGGTPTSGSFNSINWGNGAKFLHVLMNAGNGAIDLGTQQMMSVPYALYAEKVGGGDSNPSLQIGDTFAGGKIFYLDTSGEHGLVFADMDVYPQYSRSPVFNIFGDNIGAGEINSRAYLHQVIPLNISINAFNNDAVIYCDSLNYSGFSDWFLPSSYELFEMIDRNVEVFPFGLYLSSTDGFKKLTTSSNNVDGEIIVQPVLVQIGDIQSDVGTWTQVVFSLGSCFDYNGACTQQNYFVVPVRKF